MTILCQIKILLHLHFQHFTEALIQSEFQLQNINLFFVLQIFRHLNGLHFLNH